MTSLLHVNSWWNGRRAADMNPSVLGNICFVTMSLEGRCDFHREDSSKVKLQCSYRDSFVKLLESEHIHARP